MSNFPPGSFAATIKFLWVVPVSKVSLGMTMMLWLQLTYGGGLSRYCRIRRVLPFLTLELRMRLNPRYWISQISQFVFHSFNDRPIVFTSVLSAYFLLRRDGRNIFDFFKTLSIDDVSPPVLA
jgi:hypothetical protein